MLERYAGARLGRALIVISWLGLLAPAVVQAQVAPVAFDDAIRIGTGASQSVLVDGASSVLANDSDADGDALTAVLVTGPAHGTLTLNANGTFL